MKQQKKQTKKEQLEREEAIKEKFRESQKMLAVLDAFAKEEIREDFLNEKNGASFKMTQKELDLLDEFSELVQSIDLGAKLDSNASEAADHLLFLIESKNKVIPSLDVTYVDLRKLFDRIFASPYWNKEALAAEAAAAAEVAAAAAAAEAAANKAAAESQQIQASISNHVIDSGVASSVPLQSTLIEPMRDLSLEKPNDVLIHNSEFLSNFQIRLSYK